MKTAGFETIDFTDKYAAIKIHFGEYGNLAFLRPNYARVVADYVKELGGKPYLTDCNTLYVGSRKNALDHLETAYVNGFSPYQTGCHVIIGDGLKGTDETIVPIDGEYVKEAKIGRISAWAAVPGPVRWSSTVRGNQALIRVSVWAAAPATGSVPTGRLRLQTGKRRLTMINVWAAEDVWLCVRKMRLRRIMQIP